MTNIHHEAIRTAQVADLDAALAVLRSAGGDMAGPIKTLAGLRRVLAETEDMRLPLLAHHAGG